MNQIVYELRLSLRKSLFMFVYLTNESSSNPSLDLICKRVKLKHNNYFVVKIIYNFSESKFVNLIFISL